MFRTAVVLVLVLVPVYAMTNSGGPPAKRTGAPGEQTCQNGCHNSFDLNSGSGSIAISAPTQYQAGEAIGVTVQVNGGSRWGFELTAQDAQGNAVGTLMPGSDGNTARAGGDADYIAHSSSGNSTDTWTFGWTAPSEDVGEVTFYAAGVAGNGDFGNSGDRVYTTNTTLGFAATATDADAPTAFALLGNAPNPFRDATRIAFVLDAPAPVTLVIYDALGREVRRAAPTLFGAGTHHLPVSADGLAPGVYHYQVQTPTARHARTFVVQR